MGLKSKDYICPILWSWNTKLKTPPIFIMTESHVRAKYTQEHCE